MALTVQSITPNNDIDLTIDSKITITFSEPIDQFTLDYGISLYVIKDSLWSISDLLQIDPIYANIIDTDSDYIYIPLDFEINGNVITATPRTPLIPDRIHYISILPGNDSSRFVSTLTTNNPEYIRVSNSTGTIEITSAYNGDKNSSIDLLFTDTNKVDITYDGSYIDNFTGPDIDLGFISFSVSGAFENGDLVTIDVFKPIGLDTIYKTEFTTSKYNTINPPSSLIESNLNPFFIANTTPENMSINNKRCNPIIVKFNKPIKQQDLSNKINIIKSSFNDEYLRQVTFKTKIEGNILKIYLVSTQGI